MKRILILDSDKKFVKSLELLLNDRYDLISTYHPNLALSIIKKKKIDLLLTDIEFRNAQIAPFLTKIKQDHAEILVILMYTVFGREKENEYEITQLADDVLYKPFDPEILFDILNKNLSNQYQKRGLRDEKDRA